VLGEAEVRATFRASRLGVICGCMVTSGVNPAQTGACASCARAPWSGEGNIASLRRVQEDVREVAQGPRVRHPGSRTTNDAKVGDTIECFVTPAGSRRTTLERAGRDGLASPAFARRA